MRREVFWLLTVVVTLVIQLPTAERVAAQQVVDPAPVDDEQDLTSDLPLPEHSLIIESSPRDNSRAFFGVTFDPQVRNAAVARSVSAGSPADLAGVRAGDMLVSLNGRGVGTYDDVLRTVAGLKPGDVLDIEISRRVSVRARAVLDGQPVGVEHTTGYREEPESLPAPAGYQIQSPASRAPVSRVPANANLPSARQGNNAAQNRNSNVSRDGNRSRTNNANDRERNNRGRGVFSRRRG